MLPVVGVSEMISLGVAVFSIIALPVGLSDMASVGLSIIVSVGFSIMALSDLAGAQALKINDNATTDKIKYLLNVMTSPG
jgi:hypothetical protein